ncbi:transposase [Nitrosomonas sp. Is37]|uniref:transposase n=1 Tax=Nitrosomonas sp. Is37 TaxID=3080535 RepID=UPI00294B7053|nr:transposase [Nitrosomonas sp. Is37]MDV6344310.1 transposase [Nitrosomonas sp. Is37]
MAQTAAHLVDHVIPNVACAPMGAVTADSTTNSIRCPSHLLSPVLQVIQRAISTFLIKQAGFKRRNAQTGAITLIQRFGSAANLNIHLHCLVLDGVYHIQNGVPEFRSVRAPTSEQLQGLLSQIIQRIMKKSIDPPRRAH